MFRIPKQYKEQLLNRFNYDNAELANKDNFYVIKISCPLCPVYIDQLTGCGACPIDYCMDNLTRYVDTSPPDSFSFTGYLSWYKDDDDIVKQMLSEITKVLNTLVKWI